VQKQVFLGVLGLLLLLFQPLHAQKEGAVWYFGQNAGLDFNKYYPTPLTGGKINTREGVASICDKDGNLLFYTDGQTVYNSNHETMRNGLLLFGNTSSTQSSIVVPWPNSPKKYYIITVDLATSISNDPDYKGLRYSIVDFSNYSLGEVTNKNTILPNTNGILFTEKITAVKHYDKSSYWIIAHEFGSEDFYEFKLTTGGLAFYKTEAAGSVHDIDFSDTQNRGATGYLKSSPKGDLLATAIEGLKFFELFSFNNETGAINLLAKLPTGGDANHPTYTENAYGVEFSPTSNYLYGSTRKSGMLYQWDLSKAQSSSIINSVQILRQNVYGMCGALQLGLNGKIYVSLSGKPYLGVINSPIQKNCNYVEEGASLLDNTGSTVKGGRAYFGLPTFLSDFFKAAEFYYENICQSDITKFYVSASRITLAGAPTWEIYDETGTVLIGKVNVDPITYEGTYKFAQAGTYLVRFKVPQFGSTIEQRQTITIHPIPPINLPDTTVMCQGSPAHLDAGEGAFYDWSDNRNLKVERFRDIYTAGKIGVTVTHYSGCSNTDTTLIVAQPLPVLENTEIVKATCGVANGSITLTMAAGDTYDFNWIQFPNYNSSSKPELPFGTYNVIITSKTTGCSLNKTFSVSEAGAPDVVITASPVGTVCYNQKVTLRASGAQNYRWVNIENGETQTINVKPSETTTYYVQGYAIDPITQDTCSSYGQITIPVFPYVLPELGTDREACQGDTITLDGGSDYKSWRWVSTDPPLNETTRLINLTQSYRLLNLVVTDNHGCLFPDNIKITVKDLPVINLPTDTIQCQGTPMELFGGRGDSLLWSTGETTDTILAAKSGTYKLSVWGNGCVNTDSVKVTMKRLPEIELNLPRDTTICLADSIRLNGGEGDTYLWSTGDTLPDLYVSKSGNYWLTIGTEGCFNSDSTNLIINHFPLVDLGKDTVFCKSDPIRLTGDDGRSDSYQWSTQETTPGILINTTGNYSLTVGKNGCFNSDEVFIRVNDPALLVIDSVSTTQVTCPGNRDGSLKIHSHGSGTSWEYSIDGGLHYYPSPRFQGLYGDTSCIITVREDKACTATFTKKIVFEEPDSIQINYHLVSPSCENCPDGEISLSIEGGTPPYSIKWSTNDTVRFLSNAVLGKYLVWVTDAMKCNANARINLTLGFDPFEIPNAFTPNGDGVNEKWDIPALKDFKQCEMKIYNRSGKLVWWSETGYPEPWNGTDKSGTVLPVGAYYYLIWLQSDLKPLKGSVSILR